MNRAQKLHAQRLELGSFNRLDGKKVAADLEANEGLWDSFVFGAYEFQPLIELRDLRQGFINADTVFILTQKSNLPGVLELIKGWRADEVGWRTEDDEQGEFVGKSTFDLIGSELGPNHVLVRVWWD